MGPSQMPLRLGTRASRLARVQATRAVDAIATFPAIGPVTLVEITTAGDRLSARRPGAGWTSGDGQFTSEIERALIDGDIDVAVHSLKDLPTEPREELAIAAVLRRDDPRDCLATHYAGGLSELPFGARVGTSSVRRAAQLAAIRPDLVALPIRGNVDTRLRRLDEGRYDALVVAAAGLDRLGISGDHLYRLPLSIMLPAPGQAAIALQVRADRHELRSLLSGVDDPASRLAVETERALLRAIGGGCLAPLGALATVTGDRIRLRAAFETDEGLQRVDLVRPASERDALLADARRGLLAFAGASA
jgi:hydroxymethylbilane synthase